MAITMVEAAKTGGTELQRAVVEMFARMSDILMALPFSNIQGNAVSYNREGTLGTTSFRQVNAGFAESTGTLDPQKDALAIVGGDSDVDTFLVKTGDASLRTTYLRMKVKSLADLWTTKFIKGDAAASPAEFDGVQARIGSGAMRLANGATSGGDALSLTNLDAAIDAVDEPTHLFMSKGMRRWFSRAARSTSVGGYINFTQDAFGRTQTRYNDLPILVPYSANGGTEPLAFDEANPGGGSAVGTSIYVLSLKPGMLEGIQSGPVDARDLGELDTLPVLRTRIEWYAGIKMSHKRAAARLWGITNAAIVA